MGLKSSREQILEAIAECKRGRRFWANSPLILQRLSIPLSRADIRKASGQLNSSIALEKPGRTI
jgi:hypothetical protein